MVGSLVGSIGSVWFMPVVIMVWNLLSRGMPSMVSAHMCLAIDAIIVLVILMSAMVLQHFLPLVWPIVLFSLWLLTAGVALTRVRQDLYPPVSLLLSARVVSMFLIILSRQASAGVVSRHELSRLSSPGPSPVAALFAST